jgi:hypothetical protein
MTKIEGPGAGCDCAPAEDNREASPHKANADQSQALAEHAAEIRRLGKRVVGDVIAIGRHLAEARRIVGHGGWLPWLKREFGWSERQAQRYMSVVEAAVKSDNLSDLEIPVSGLYLLAAPSTPVEARDEIVARAKAGETISTKTIKQAIATKKTPSPAVKAAADRAVASSEQQQRRQAAAVARDDQTAAKRSLVTGVAMAPHAERGLDLYETPEAAVHALLRGWAFIGPIWEPACGPGAIVRVLRAFDYDVVATDIEDYGCPGARGGIDFLMQAQAPAGVKNIITNPPYRLANKFVRHALELVPRVAMLLPLRFLESSGRNDILDGGTLAHVFVFRNRLPMMHRAGWHGPRIKTGAIAFAWFVWAREHRGPTTIERITCAASAPTPPAPIPDDLSIPADGSIPPFLRRTAP